MCLTDGIFGRQLHIIRVEKLQEGAIDWVGELVYFYHFLHVFVPVGLEHGPEVFTPAVGEDQHKRHLFHS